MQPELLVPVLVNTLIVLTQILFINILKIYRDRSRHKFINSIMVLYFARDVLLK